MSRKSSQFANKLEESFNYSKVVLLFVLAGTLRYILMTSKYQTVISNHIEVSTPLSSWKRVSEGILLLSKNINPYEGDLLHETPLSLWFYKIALDLLKDIKYMFIIADLCTGLFLYVSARRFLIYLKKEHKDTNKFAKDIEYCLLTDDEYRKIPLYVLMAVLFNPFTLIGCIGYSTIQIHNFFLSIFLCSLVYGELILGPAALAICTSVSFYPFILIVPYCISFITVHKHKIKASLVLLFYVVFLALITMCNSNWGTDYSFVKNVYGCILTVPDLQPNIGLFWYFFTEMFDHFRDLFIYSFQINATILYLVPLSLKFRNQPFLLVVSLLFLISIFKSYPCVSDLGFVLSVLPNFLHLFPFCQQGFLVGVIFLITTTLAPILWYLWIYCNSANANFYFGVTLAFAIAQIFLITDILFAQIKREFTLNNGKERKIDGDEAILSLE